MSCCETPNDLTSRSISFMWNSYGHVFIFSYVHIFTFHSYVHSCGMKGKNMRFKLKKVINEIKFLKKKKKSRKGKRKNNRRVTSTRFRNCDYW